MVSIQNETVRNSAFFVHRLLKILMLALKCWSMGVSMSWSSKESQKYSKSCRKKKDSRVVVLRTQYSEDLIPVIHVMYDLYYLSVPVSFSILGLLRLNLLRNTSHVWASSLPSFHETTLNFEKWVGHWVGALDKDSGKWSSLLWCSTRFLHELKHVFSCASTSHV